MTYDEKDFVLNKERNKVVYIKNKVYTMTVNRKPITITPEIERFLINYDMCTCLPIYDTPEKLMLLDRIVPYTEEGWGQKFYDRFQELHPPMQMSIWYETDEYKPQAKKGQYTFLVFTLKDCYTWYVTTREEKKLVNMLKQSEQTSEEIQANVVDFFEVLYPTRFQELGLVEEDEEGYDEYNSYKKMSFRRVAYSFLTSKGFPVKHEPIPQKPQPPRSPRRRPRPPKPKQPWYDKLLGWTIIGGFGVATFPFLALAVIAIGIMLYLMGGFVIMAIYMAYSLLFHIIS